MNTMALLAPVACETLVVGAGIAGCWTALNLVERGINTALIYYDDTDRGGRIGSTAISVGAINTAPLQRADYIPWLEEMGRGQMHTSVAPVTVNNLAAQLEKLREFDALKPIELGLALASGSGKKLIDQLLAVLAGKGVTLIKNGWVQRIDASETECRGVQYQQGEHCGYITAAALVLAPGGYSGLFQGAVKTGTYGAIHGRFLLAGGKLSNLEFVFKHGYGQPDLGKLTPTEELPGVEIYDVKGQHVSWLEEELFYGRGTHNHFQAFMTWRKDEDTHYYVDFRFRDFHRTLSNWLKQPPTERSEPELIEQLSVYVDDSAHEAFMHWLMPFCRAERDYRFSDFCAVKPLLAAACAVDKHRIRQIAYFSMGGILHHSFLTNLHQVFVNGEAMHDYGAHRVGGLPWALYLSAAQKIAEDIAQLKQRGQLNSAHNNADNKLPIIAKASQFDGNLLAQIQQQLFEFQERGQHEAALSQLIDWLRTQRAQLAQAGRELDDAYAYLALAEAIVVSSVVRRESRGCFFRSDYHDENFNLRAMRSVASFDEDSGQVCAALVNKTRILDLVANRGAGKLKMELGSEQQNAAYFLVKKHLATAVANQTAICFEGQSISYAGLNQRIEHYAHFLFSQELMRGDRVAILLRDSPEWIALFIACLQLGLIAVPLNTFAKEADLIFYLQDSQARLLVTEQSLLGKLNVSAIFAQVQSRILTLEDLLPLPAAQIHHCVAVDEQTPGFILYTSGSTGKPKGALHKHSNLAATAKQFAAQVLAPQTGERFYSSSRLFFAYGLGNSLTFPLYFGCTSVLSGERLSPADTLKLLAQQAVSHFFSVPAIYAALMPLLTQQPLSESVRLCISAGEPLSALLAQDWVQQTQRVMVDGLGSTEALHIFCCSYYYPSGEFTQGQAVAGYQLQLLDDNNFVIHKTGVTGNLAVRGNSIASGYWQQPEASSKTFVQDLLLTGDQYQLTPAQEFNYIGRKGDMFKASGLWVSAYEIEVAMRSLDYIADAALVVYRNTAGEQTTAAFVCPATAALSPADLHQFERFSQQLGERLYSDLSALLSRHKLPGAIYLLSEMPRTATGKLSKPTLKELALAKDEAAAKSAYSINKNSTTNKNNDNRTESTTEVV